LDFSSHTESFNIYFIEKLFRFFLGDLFWQKYTVFDKYSQPKVHRY
jgi:hypothetical protein